MGLRLSIGLRPPPPEPGDVAALAEADVLPPPPLVALPAGMRWVERARAMSLLPSRRLWWWMVVDGGGWWWL